MEKYNKIIGNYGEDCATKFLKKNKYKIIEKNYSCKFGEIDIIAKDKNYLVFVEVKARMSRKFGDPLEAINVEKQNKIRAVATMYLMQNKLMETNCRFDAIAVLGEMDEDICHIENAF